MRLIRRARAWAWDYDVAQLFGCFAIILTGGIAIVAIFTGVVKWQEKTTCERIAQSEHLEYRWDFWEGCSYKLVGRWIPFETWRHIQLQGVQLP